MGTYARTKVSIQRRQFVGRGNKCIVIETLLDEGLCRRLPPGIDNTIDRIELSVHEALDLISRLTIAIGRLMRGK